ncbi:MAG: T9SS type A sorting domain-containing protein [Bacteroidia bacterium]|nr:T9SS type A sorting domain-containing protein [Bacteroidia bacterium]
MCLRYFLVFSFIFSAFQLHAQKLQWANAIGDSYEQAGTDLAYDFKGNVFVTGKYIGSLDFDPGPGKAILNGKGPYANSYNIFLAKYNKVGGYEWAFSIGREYAVVGQAITCDSKGNVILTGCVGGASVDLDPGTGEYLVGSDKESSIFMAKYSPQGTLMWASHIKKASGAAENHQLPYDVACDGKDNIYLVGSFSIQSMDFDPGPGVVSLTGKGSTDIFMAKYSGTGKYIWAKSIGGVGSDICYEMAIHCNGDIAITGWFETEVDFDPGPGVKKISSRNPDTYDAYVAKFDNNCTLQWVYSMSKKEDSYAFSVCFDPKGNVFVSGWNYSSDVFFTTGPAQSPPVTISFPDLQGGMYFAKYSPNGVLQWAKPFAASKNGWKKIYAIRTDFRGDLYVAGYFKGWPHDSVDFDPGPGVANLIAGKQVPTRNSFRLTDGFVAKYTNNGQYLMAFSIGETYEDAVLDLLPDNEGNIFVTGYIHGFVDFDPDPLKTVIRYGEYPNGAYPMDTDPDIFIAKYAVSSPNISVAPLSVSSTTSTEGNIVYTVQLNEPLKSGQQLVLQQNTTACGWTSLSTSPFMALSARTYSIELSPEALHQPGPFRLVVEDAEGEYILPCPEDEMIKNIPVQLSSYPNPSSGAFAIEVTSSVNTGVAEITDYYGKSYWHGTIAQKQKIITASWPCGIYFIRYTDSSGTAIHKFVVANK